MPAIVRGGGGGKNTKDATAVPEDVKKGKVFYNNQGKQTGTLEASAITLKSMELTFPDLSGSSLPNVPNGTAYAQTCLQTYPVSELKQLFISEYTSFTFKYSKKIALRGKIKFVEVSHHKNLLIPLYYNDFSGYNRTAFFWQNANNQDKMFSLVHDGNYIYLCNYDYFLNSSKIKIYYE